jgi:hypothetical protein
MGGDNKPATAHPLPAWVLGDRWADAEPHRHLPRLAKPEAETLEPPCAMASRKLKDN